MPCGVLGRSRARLGARRARRVAQDHGPHGAEGRVVRAGVPRHRRGRPRRGPGGGRVRRRRRRRRRQAREAEGRGGPRPRRGERGQVVVAKPALRASVTGAALPLGEPVRVRLTEASVEERRIAFVLAEGDVPSADGDVGAAGERGV
ncbi:hypothetical protein [Luteimicrobium album]|uniref:hypothetical protein n=1 Tax=Luteimicrobium album TaxID=1054550 RepID=UPI0024E0AADE|nr:hypothetical protein [Luteimicrobium album]